MTQPLTPAELAALLATRPALALDAMEIFEEFPSAAAYMNQGGDWPTLIVRWPAAALRIARFVLKVEAARKDS